MSFYSLLRNSNSQSSETLNMEEACSKNSDAPNAHDSLKFEHTSLLQSENSLDVATSNFKALKLAEPFSHSPIKYRSFNLSTVNEGEASQQPLAPTHDATHTSENKPKAELGFLATDILSAAANRLSDANGSDLAGSTSYLDCNNLDGSISCDPVALFPLADTLTNKKGLASDCLQLAEAGSLGVPRSGSDESLNNTLAGHIEEIVKDPKHGLGDSASFVFGVPSAVPDNVQKEDRVSSKSDPKLQSDAQTLAILSALSNRVLDGLSPICTSTPRIAKPTFGEKYQLTSSTGGASHNSRLVKPGSGFIKKSTGALGQATVRISQKLKSHMSPKRATVVKAKIAKLTIPTTYETVPSYMKPTFSSLGRNRQQQQHPPTGGNINSSNKIN